MKQTAAGGQQPQKKNKQAAAGGQQPQKKNKQAAADPKPVHEKAPTESPQQQKKKAKGKIVQSNLTQTNLRGYK